MHTNDIQMFKMTEQRKVGGPALKELEKETFPPNEIRKMVIFI